MKYFLLCALLLFLFVPGCGTSSNFDPSVATVEQKRDSTPPESRIRRKTSVEILPPSTLEIVNVAK
jgi:hypothetical protein